MKRFFSYLRNIFCKKRAQSVVNTDDRDYAYNAMRADKRKEVDRLLDKINEYGAESLTKSEREFLKNTHGL